LFFAKHRKHFARIVTQRVLAAQRDTSERMLMLAGQQACWRVHQASRIRNLADVEFRVFSQWGEDGIIEWLVAALPEISPSFVEFGVEAYAEANTRFLLQNRNWRGLILDSDRRHGSVIRADPLYWRHDVTFRRALVTTENIDGLISDSGFAGDLGILSIDVDGNDYWILDRIACVRPAIIICEVNPVFGDQLAVTIPYQPDFDRFRAHHSGLYFGASIAALRTLAERKGYRFIGTSSSGINSFFVRDDLADGIEARIGERRAWPSRHRDSRAEDGTLDFAPPSQRYERIKHLPVVNLTTGMRAPLADLGPAFSDDWLHQLAAGGPGHDG
jgi:hypothetical protein